MKGAIMPIKGRKNVDRAIEKRYLAANDDIRGVYLQGLYNVVLGTPVDEGRARNNWFLTIGAASGNSTTSKSKGLSAIRSIRQMPKRVMNQKIFFTNNLPYIETLEYGRYPNPSKGEKTTGGYSTQVTQYKSPKGWVRATLKSMASKVRRL